MSTTRMNLLLFWREMLTFYKKNRESDWVKILKQIWKSDGIEWLIHLFNGKAIGEKVYIQNK